jgi:hypothetical protein
VRRRPLATVVVGISLLLVGCGDEATEPLFVPGRPATLAELVGPWRATPLLLDAVTRQRVQEACRRDIELPPGSAAAVIDARGAGVATVRMTGQGSGSCHALQITPAGQVVGAGGGWSSNAAELPPRLPDAAFGEIEWQSIAGGDLKVQGWSVQGSAGPQIAAVVVVPQDGVAVTATFVGGWFAAWWPRRIGDPPLDGMAHPPVVVRGYDAFGALLVETSLD